MVAKIFKWPVRVYFEDTDSGGVVYHANYLNFMERARTEWLRSLGIDQRYLKREENTIFVVHQISIQYIKPAVFNDHLMVTTEVMAVGASRVKLTQTIMNEGRILTSANVDVACIDAQKFKAKRIPNNIKQLME
jgi:acyl-CoA thioester hydrolase